MPAPECLTLRHLPVPVAASPAEEPPDLDHGQRGGVVSVLRLLVDESNHLLTVSASFMLFRHNDTFFGASFASLGTQSWPIYILTSSATGLYFF